MYSEDPNAIRIPAVTPRGFGARRSKSLAAVTARLQQSTTTAIGDAPTHHYLRACAQMGLGAWVFLTKSSHFMANRWGGAPFLVGRGRT